MSWIVGDVHGCAQELAQLLQAMKAHGPSTVVLVGDLYTKGPDPAGVWRLVRDHSLQAVLGNHDLRLLEVLDGRRTGDEHAQAVIAALDREDPSWRAHLSSLPLHRDVDGWTIVHAALHPSGDLSRTSRRDFIARRRWPEEAPSDPYWWSVYRGERRIVFGHDAARGLVQVWRGGRLHVAGLDTGCVYGGRLTAMRTGDQHLLQVSAAEPYQAIRRPRP